MKKYGSILILLGALGLAGCSGGGGGGGSSSDSTAGTFAATPQPCNGYNGFACNNANTYDYCASGNCTYGDWQFPPTYTVTTGTCGCNGGYFPVYGQNFGFACAPFTDYANMTWISAATIGNQQPNRGNDHRHGRGRDAFGNFVVYGTLDGYDYWDGQGQNTGWTNNQPISYQGAIPPGSNPSCWSSTAQGCDLRLNDCGGMGRCQPVGGGSTIGICIR